MAENIVTQVEENRRIRSAPSWSNEMPRATDMRRIVGPPLNLPESH